MTDRITITAGKKKLVLERQQDGAWEETLYVGDTTMSVLKNQTLTYAHERIMQFMANERNPERLDRP